MKIQTEVLIIGGGVTGVGVARDLALRGIPSVLIEKGDFSSGASGRNHGLFHSGARYAVSDPEAAKECIDENRVLGRIGPHCIEATDGLFISLSEDGLVYRDQFLRACEKAAIPTTLYSRDEALDLEPGLNPGLLSAVRIPDGAIDPFTLIVENARDAEEGGAKFLLYTEPTALVLERNRVKGVKAKDRINGEEHLIEASFLVNATGAWANHFLELAGLRVAMALSKGTMLVTNQRVSQRVINRCRRPADGDIIVPNETVSILGTTAVRSEEVENFEVTPSEVSLLIEEGSKMIPSLKESRFIRAYAGVRPLVQPEEIADDRSISRGFTLIDHGKRDGVENLITITGGKLTTYRLMAERASDLICQKRGVQVSCSTHLRPLPGANQPAGLKERLKNLDHRSPKRGEILCDCEMVGRIEVERCLREDKIRTYQDILHRTRLAKGTCQGGFCVYRFLGMLHDLKMGGPASNEILKSFLEERWRGIRPVLWGSAVKEEELIESIYKGIFNLTG